jgi:hypothetical protein
MTRDANPFVFRLFANEIAELKQPAGEGGFQSFQTRLLNELETSGDTITLTDEEMGKLLRYMTRYKSGGFQGHLRSALIRSFRSLIDD